MLSLTISLVAVFLPLLLMPGITGRLFHQFAWVLSIAVVFSMLISLTLTPMMCAYLLKADELPEGEDAHERAHAAGKVTWWSKLVGLYERSLDVVLSHPRITLGVAGGAVALTVLLYVAIPKGLLPDQDTGLVTAVVQADHTVAFEQMHQRTIAVAEALRKDPAVTGVAAFIGAGTLNPTLNQAQLSIVLADRSERENVARILPRLQEAAAGIPGVTLALKPVQDVTLDTRVASTEYQFVLSDVDAGRAEAEAVRLIAALQARKELRDVDSNLGQLGRALAVNVDRDKAAMLGVPMQTIDDTLYDAYGQRQISTIFTNLNQYRVVLEVAPEFRTRTALMEQLAVASNGAGALTGSNATTFGMVTSANSSTATGVGERNTGLVVGGGGAIPLSAIASAEVTTAPLLVSHQQQLPAISIGFNLAEGYSLSEGVAAIEQEVERLQLGDTVHATFTGKAAEYASSRSNVVWLLLASLVVIYIVLGVLYESWIHPITIISTLPPAGVGALLALMVFGKSLSVDGIVGIILLLGIVKKNGIMMVDFAIEARRAGATAHDAIRRACLLRFRPIMMTTACALLGALPLALGTGIGSELRQPLGISIVGGLLLSQLVTLYTTPVIYLYMERMAAWWQSRRAPAHAPQAA